MEIVDAAQHMLVVLASATGLMFLTVIVVTLLVALVAVQVSWKVKVIFLLALANEIRGIAVVTPIALAIFHH